MDLESGTEKKIVSSATLLLERQKLQCLDCYRLIYIQCGINMLYFFVI